MLEPLSAMLWVFLGLKLLGHVVMLLNFTEEAILGIFGANGEPNLIGV